ILVVDDSEVNRKILITVLQSLGNFIIDEAVMGTEAVEKVKYRREPYDVIFMDLTMPVMGGREATQKIKKELGSPSRVIAVTGDSISSKEMNLLYEVGFLAVQPKPFTKENIEKFL
ncbi:CheY-like superfamily, partial [Obelidium mucronatum]